MFFWLWVLGLEFGVCMFFVEGLVTVERFIVRRCFVIRLVFVGLVLVVVVG